ncbi:hypothetical protein EMCRGX_G011223 [Ephydatia muelleri]
MATQWTFVSSSSVKMIGSADFRCDRIKGGTHERLEHYRWFRMAGLLVLASGTSRLATKRLPHTLQRCWTLALC